MKVIEAPVVRPRGRKSTPDPVLTKNLKALKVGQWAIFDEMGKVTDKSKQSAVSQKIRSNFKGLNLGENVKVSIRFSPDGDVQVGITKSDT